MIGHNEQNRKRGKNTTTEGGEGKKAILRLSQGLRSTFHSKITWGAVQSLIQKAPGEENKNTPSSRGMGEEEKKLNSHYMPPGVVVFYEGEKNTCKGVPRKRRKGGMGNKDLNSRKKRESTYFVGQPESDLSEVLK